MAIDPSNLTPEQAARKEELLEQQRRSNDLSEDQKEILRQLLGIGS